VSTQHSEFPELTPEVRAAYKAGCLAAPFSWTAPTLTDRRYLAAFLREAMKQAKAAGNSGSAWSTCQELAAIANNLHTPPPPPPTLAEAREAARQLGGANAEVVHAFLASLGEGVQP
jgi:hypothetical protein